MNLHDVTGTAGLSSPIRDQLFIGGRFVDAASGETLPTLNPHDNSVIAHVAMAGREDVDRAVAAAQRAFPAWSRMAAADRGRILLRLADLIETNADELARLESLGTGHPLRDSKRVNPGSPFGGNGASGYGREMGFDAMREYTQVKSVWVNVDAQIPAWYAR